MPVLPGSVDIAPLMLIEEEAAEGARASADQCAPARIATDRADCGTARGAHQSPAPGAAGGGAESDRANAAVSARAMPRVFMGRYSDGYGLTGLAQDREQGQDIEGPDRQLHRCDG